MKKLALLILFSLFSRPIFSQNICRTDILNGDSLIRNNCISVYNQFDFSNLWLSTPEKYVYGIIGDDYQRLSIKFTEIRKDSKNPNKYWVKGKSLAKENICDFSGSIELKEIYETVRASQGVDDQQKSKVKKQGLAIARYEFAEDLKQVHNGVFNGILKTKWFIDTANSIQYDNINKHADGYFNNAFVGTWTSNKTEVQKICHWGDFRVPEINCDFDIGTGEFNVSKKYWDKGWLDIALLNNATKQTTKQKSSRTKKPWWQ